MIKNKQRKCKDIRFGDDFYEYSDADVMYDLMCHMRKHPMGLFLPDFNRRLLASLYGRKPVIDLSG